MAMPSTQCERPKQAHEPAFPSEGPSGNPGQQKRGQNIADEDRPQERHQISEGEGGMFGKKEFDYEQDPEDRDGGPERPDQVNRDQDKPVLEAKPDSPHLLGRLQARLEKNREVFGPRGAIDDLEARLLEHLMPRDTRRRKLGKDQFSEVTTSGRRTLEIRLTTSAVANVPFPAAHQTLIPLVFKTIIQPSIPFSCLLSRSKLIL